MVLAKVILYHSPLDASSRFIRLLLAEKGIDFSLQFEKHWQKREAFYAINPTGEIPALTTIDGNVCGSIAIAEFLEDVVSTNSLFGSNPMERAESRRLLDIFVIKFGREVNRCIVNERVFKYMQGKPSKNKVIQVGRSNMKQHMKYLEHLIIKNGCLHLKTPSIADFAAAAHLSSLDYLNEVPWASFPNVKNWYARIKSRPSFKAILNDRISFMEPAKHYSNLDF